MPLARGKWPSGCLSRLFPPCSIHPLTQLLRNSGYFASSCDEVAPISIWLQIPNVALGAMSEIFVNVTSYELAYARKHRSLSFDPSQPVVFWHIPEQIALGPVPDD